MIDVTAYAVEAVTVMVVTAADPQAARIAALAEIARRCATGNGVDVRVEELLSHIPHGEARVGKDKLNVRVDPVLTAKILGQLAPGELVTMWALDNGWAIVQNVAGLTGWAVAEYMTVGELVP